MRRTTLLVFSVALSARAVVSALQVTQGIHPIPWFPTLPMWSDFYDVYGHQLKLLAEGLIPYRDFANSYTPLFLYTLLPAFLVGGVAAASIPIVLSDALSAALIYNIISLRSSYEVALTGGLAYALMPLVLIDVGYLWLGSQPVTFFILLGTYYLLRERLLASSIFLGIAVLFQPEALFMLPVLVVLQVRKFGRSAWKGMSSFLTVIFVVSAPFLLICGRQYVLDITYGLFARWYAGSSIYPPFGTTSAVSGLSTSLVQLGRCPATASLLSSLSFSCVRYPNPVLTIWVDSVTWISGVLVIPLLTLLLVALHASRRNDNFVELLLGYSLVALLVAFSLLIHTTLTYYFIPAYALLLCASRTKFSAISTALFATLSLTVVSGPFLEVLPLGAMLVLISSQDAASRPLERMN